MQHETCNTWHVTHDTWHKTCVAKRCPENISSAVKVSKCFTKRPFQSFFCLHKLRVVIFQVLSKFQFFFQVLSQFAFLSFVIVWVLVFCHYSSFVTTWVLSQFEFCHQLSCHKLSFVTTWFLSQFEFCRNLSFATSWVLSHFEFEFYHNFSF